MTEAPRVILLDHTDTPIGELDPTRLRGLVATSVVNGEHALEVTTTQELSKNDRLLYEDGRGYWHEYVVEGIETEHGGDGDVVSAYYCVWSLQHDLAQTFVDNEYGCGIVPGHASVMHPAVDGLTIALSSTQRWAVGTVTVTAQAAASFYRRSGWEALQTVIEKWGGELQASIDVDASGVVSREVDLLEKVGQLTATRRFDYGGDVSGIVRTVADDPWTCRIIPLGKGQETEEGGYTRRPTIASVNSGVMWLENANAVSLCRVPDGAGGWEYPVQIVYNDTYEEPADLKAWALDHLTDYTQPKVSYQADVMQFARAGMSPHGVSLGDEVAVVDRGFGDDGLQLEARVLKIVENLLDASDIELTISTVPVTLADQLNGISASVANVSDQLSSADVWRASGGYATNLINRINQQANATGGYTYITEGEGSRTYDVAVSDPLVGAEASQVVEVKGGTIRIANTKDSAGNWKWKTLIVSGLVASECIAAMSAGGGGMARVVSDGLEILDDNGVVVAKFGATERIGLPTQNNIVVDSSGFKFNNNSEQVGTIVGAHRRFSDLGLTGDMYDINMYSGEYLNGYQAYMQMSTTVEDLTGDVIQSVVQLNSYSDTYGEAARVYVRSDFHGGKVELYASDGTWVRNPDNNDWLHSNYVEVGHPRVLWSGASYMTASQTEYLSDSVLNMAHGIVVVFEEYENGTVLGYAQTFFIPKTLFLPIGTDFWWGCTLSRGSFQQIGHKDLHFYEGYIVGAASNYSSGTATGSDIKFDNTRWVMTQVIGV